MWLEIKTWSYLELSSFTKCAKFFNFFSPQLIPMSSLLNCVPFVLKTCSCANMPCVLTCSRTKCLACLHAYMPTYLACSCAYVPTRLVYLRACVSSMLTCLCANVSCVLTRSRANVPWVPCLIWLALPCDHLLTCFVSSVSSFDVTFCSFTAIVVGAVNTELYADLPVGSI